MKRENIYKITFFLLLIAAVTVYFYSANKEQPAIPELRERQGPISTTSEWLNTKAAIQGLQFKLRKNPGDTQSKLLLALAYMQEARVTGEHPYYFPAALQLVNEVLNRKNADPAIHFEAVVAKAMIQLSLHKFEDALKTGQEALRLNNKRAAVYGVLCDANVELGNYEEAIKMADQMVAIRPDLMSYSRVSYLREIHGDMPGAIEAMEMAARAGHPGLEQTAWTKVTLAGLYERTGKLELAEKTYNYIMEERPDYAFALGGLGRLEAKKGNFEKATEYLHKASSVIPEFSFQEELTHVYLLTGQKSKAQKTMQELLEGLKEDQEAGHIVDLELANIHLELGNDHDQALHYASKEYTRRPNNIEVCKTMAAIYYKKQDYEKANTYLQKAMRTNSQDATLMCLNGLINYKLGNHSEGQELIRQSFALNPFQNNSVGSEGQKILTAGISSL